MADTDGGHIYVDRVLDTEDLIWTGTQTATTTTQPITLGNYPGDDA